LIEAPLAIELDESEHRPTRDASRRAAAPSDEAGASAHRNVPDSKVDAGVPGADAIQEMEAREPLAAGGRLRGEHDVALPLLTLPAVAVAHPSHTWRPANVRLLVAGSLPRCWDFVVQPPVR
jgi:hypothetical protein